MNTAKSYATQIVLPNELYRAISELAKVHGHSVDSEIVTLLAISLNIKISEDEALVDEFLAWETASDEDWLKMEDLLVHEAS
jgi:hypothetical protein